MTDRIISTDALLTQEARCAPMLPDGTLLPSDVEFRWIDIRPRPYGEEEDWPHVRVTIVHWNDEERIDRWSFVEWRMRDGAVFGGKYAFPEDAERIGKLRDKAIAWSRYAYELHLARGAG